MKIKIKIKNVYGNELIYPMCDKGKLICCLTDRKTFTEWDIDLCRKLGYTFVNK